MASRSGNSGGAASERSNLPSVSNVRSRALTAAVGVAVLAIAASLVGFLARDKSGGGFDLVVAPNDSVPTNATLPPASVATLDPSATTVPAVATETTLPGTNPIETTVTTAVSATPCPAADGTSPRLVTFTAPPSLCIDPTATYKATIRTSKGTMVAELDPVTAPKTVNNFVVLARYHFYDGIPFHRVVRDYIVQGGDPSGTGDGGPGYAFDDELPASSAYRVGTLAMANSGPNTNGSQFFIVSGDRAAAIDPTFPIFGAVTQGLDVLDTINRTGTDDGTPGPEKVTIQAITIEEQKPVAPSTTVPSSAASATTAAPPATTGAPPVGGSPITGNAASASATTVSATPTTVAPA